MANKFKAVVIDNQNEKFTRDIKEIDNSHLKDGNVLVKVDYSSLNLDAGYRVTVQDDDTLVEYTPSVAKRDQVD